MAITTNTCGDHEFDRVVMMDIEYNPWDHSTIPLWLPWLKRYYIQSEDYKIDEDYNSIKPTAHGYSAKLNVHFYNPDLYTEFCLRWL